MKYPFMVNYNGVYYKAGEEVPDSNVGNNAPSVEEVKPTEEKEIKQPKKSTPKKSK